MLKNKNYYIKYIKLKEEQIKLLNYVNQYSKDNILCKNKNE